MSNLPSRTERSSSRLGTKNRVLCILYICILLAFIGGGFLQHIQNLNAQLVTLKAELDAPEEIVSEETPLSRDTPHYFEVGQYRFPNVQDRLRYYMGQWYDKFDWTPTNSTCQQLNKVRDSLTSYETETLFTTAFLVRCSRAKIHMSLFCYDAYNEIRGTFPDANDRNHRWLVSFGDRTKRFNDALPTISKARPSIFSKSPTNIIWLLNRRRHYHELEDYHRNIVQAGKEIPWSEKLSKVVWRGVSTGNRIDYVAQFVKYNDNRLDIAFNKMVQTQNEFMRKYATKQYVRPHMPIAEINRYKYLLSFEGNDVASGLKWMLYSNSVVFMAKPTVASWAMEDLLVPFVHYIPLADDYSNLLQMVQWAEEHDEACQEISKRATEYMEHLWISENAKKNTEFLVKTLVTSYANQFNDALSKCDPSPR